VELTPKFLFYQTKITKKMYAYTN